jgi:Fe-S cluster assembly iron-binding protein IscA
MLQITDAAMGVLRDVRASSDAPDDAAARFALTTQEGQQGIGFMFSSDPVEGDQKVADDGELEVYVAPELAEPLGTAVVDATDTDQGTELVLREEESPAG